MSSKADFYFGKQNRWTAAIAMLREIVLGAGLEEDLKWGCPCYTLVDANVVLIHVFKEYCALLFFKGALMADPEGLLIQQTKNVQTPRQLRFTTIDDIASRKTAIRNYILEAIRVEKAGLKADKNERPPLEFPEEFQIFLDADPDLKIAFEALTPGRQRAYNLFFTAPKQSKTRTARVERSIPGILDGKGLED